MSIYEEDIEEKESHLILNVLLLLYKFFEIEIIPYPLRNLEREYGTKTS